MVFSSVVFLFYFLPAFFLLYFAVPGRFKNATILLGSIFFYAWGAPLFIFVILGTTLLDFVIVRGMDATKKPVWRKLLLLASLTVNLGLLFYFKYSNFFVDSLNSLITAAGGNAIPWLKLALPIGISFYTFETITYVVDVYRRVHAPLRNFWDYQTYIILFPKLIAGPIVRYHDIADQLSNRAPMENSENRLRGLHRFFLGLGKKVIIANAVGAYANAVFGLPVESLGSGTAWLGALSYAFQIYFDFSGYSDMAIGLALMMGFRLPENFNNPYTATSITDFWRRWHITLGAWMRSYLYIPLGGNRVHSRGRLYFNLLLVFLASGLWHGAAWGFVFWGLYHGFFLIIERMFLGRWLERIGKFSVVYAFGVVVVGWVAFRIERLAPSVRYLKVMLSGNGSTAPQPQPDKGYFFFLALAVFFSFFTLLPGGRWLQQRIYDFPYSRGRQLAMTFVSMVLLLLCAGRIVSADFNPFIYFRF